MVLLILPVVWAVVLIPPWIRRWRQGRAVRSVASFNRQLSSIERSLAVPDGEVRDGLRSRDEAGIVPPAPAPTRRASRLALRRRRQMFFGLLAAFFVSLGVAIWFGSSITWLAHGSIAVLFLGYMVLLVRHHRRTVERVTKVRQLSPRLSPITGGTRRYVRRPSVVVLGGDSVPSA